MLLCSFSFFYTLSNTLSVCSRPLLPPLIHLFFLFQSSQTFFSFRPHCSHPFLPSISLISSFLLILFFSRSPPLLFLLSLSDAGCYGLWAAMGLFCLSRHLRLLFRSQSRSGGVERVRGHAAVVVCTNVCEWDCVCDCCLWCGCTGYNVLDVPNDYATRLPEPDI